MGQAYPQRLKPRSLHVVMAGLKSRPFEDRNKVSQAAFGQVFVSWARVSWALVRRAPIGQALVSVRAG